MSYEIHGLALKTLGNRRIIKYKFSVCAVYALVQWLRVQIQARKCRNNVWNWQCDGRQLNVPSFKIWWTEQPNEQCTLQFSRRRSWWNVKRRNVNPHRVCFVFILKIYWFSINDNDIHHSLEFTKLALTNEWKKIYFSQIQSTDTKLNLHLLFSYTPRKLDRKIARSHRVEK